MKKLFTIFVLMSVLFVYLVSCSGSMFSDAKYNRALKLIEDGEYDKAYNLLISIQDDARAVELLQHFIFVHSEITVSQGNTQLLSLELSCYENGLPKRFSLCQENETKSAEFSYDKSGRLSKTIITDASGSYTITDYAYDAHNRLIKEVATTPNKGQSFCEYTYDDNGQLVKKITSDLTGQKTTYEWSYNVDGNVLVETVTLSNGSTTTTINTYNLDGKITKSETYSNESKRVTDYIYDANGRMIERVETSPYGAKETLRYTYDSDGRVIQEFYQAGTSNVWIRTTDFVYDNDDRTIKLTINTNGNVTTIEYLYQKDGTTVAVGTSSNGTTETQTSKTICVYYPFELPDSVQLMWLSPLAFI